MPSLNSLERKFGRFAIPYLIPAIALFQLLNFFLLDVNPKFIGFLVYIPAAILDGEVWRLLTWILVPKANGILWIVISTLFTMWIGKALEDEWGAFKVTAFVFVTLLAVAIVGLAFVIVVPAIGPIPIRGLSIFFSGALLAAFAFLFPDKEILLFFVIPIKVKWLGFFAAGLAIFTMITSPPLAPFVIACWAGFLLFVAPEAAKNIKQGRTAAARKAKFDAARPSEDEAFHTCKTCGTTDIVQPETEFRIAPDGEEYCVSCLETKATR